MNDKETSEFVKKCWDLLKKGVTDEQWEFATLLREALALLEPPCQTCKGSGKCVICKGSGSDPKEHGLKMCWNCGGKGKCPDCKDRPQK